MRAGNGRTPSPGIASRALAMRGPAWPPWMGAFCFHSDSIDYSEAMNTPRIRFLVGPFLMGALLVAFVLGREYGKDSYYRALRRKQREAAAKLPRVKR